jgi:hypothetical protein
VKHVWGNPQGKTPVGGSRRKWENIKLKVKEMSSEDVDRADLYHSRIRKNRNYRPSQALSQSYFFF